MSQECRLKNIEQTKNYLFEEIELNELMSRKHKKVCTTVNYFNTFLFQFLQLLDVFKFLLLLLCWRNYEFCNRD